MTALFFAPRASSMRLSIINSAACRGADLALEATIVLTPIQVRER